METGGFTFEDQIFKGLAMGAPFVKLVGMARGPIAAAMVGKTIDRTIEEGQVPVYLERFGSTKDEIFVTASELRKELGDQEFDRIPTGALGLFTYYERLAQGLRQLMAGSREFTCAHISRDDLSVLTREAAEVSGITYVIYVDRTEAQAVLKAQERVGNNRQARAGRRRSRPYTRGGDGFATLSQLRHRSRAT